MLTDNDLIAREDEIKQLILDFHESIKDKITHTSYVIDFYLKKNNDVLIIELNPFHNGAGRYPLTLIPPRIEYDTKKETDPLTFHSSGAALFSWAKDRERFMHGPFELRITKELKENPKEILPAFWVRFINSCFVEEPKGTAAQAQEDQEGSSKCILC